MRIDQRAMNSGMKPSSMSAAAETGGKYFPLNDAKDLLDEITLLEGKNSERVSKDLWDMPINFILLVGLAGAEWFLRKRKGLA